MTTPAVDSVCLPCVVREDRVVSVSGLEVLDVVDWLAVAGVLVDAASVVSTCTVVVVTAVSGVSLAVFVVAPVLVVCAVVENTRDVVVTTTAVVG